MCNVDVFVSKKGSASANASVSVCHFEYDHFPGVCICMLYVYVIQHASKFIYLRFVFYDPLFLYLPLHCVPVPCLSPVPCSPLHTPHPFQYYFETDTDMLCQHLNAFHEWTTWTFWSTSDIFIIHLIFFVNVRHERWRDGGWCVRRACVRAIIVVGIIVVTIIVFISFSFHFFFLLCRWIFKLEKIMKRMAMCREKEQRRQQKLQQRKKNLKTTRP